MKELKNKIIKVVPSIVKWQNGALVQFEWYGSFTDESGNEQFSQEPDEFKIGIILENEILGCNLGEGLKKEDFKNGIFKEKEGDVWEYIKAEIIGRPITLVDCTNAIFKSKRWRGLELKEQVKDFLILNMCWDCENDNLDNQTKQTIDFLKKIL